MTIVEMPFRERFKVSLLNGTKTATTRTSRKGIRGDVFKIFGAKFEITNVERVRLWYVAQELWKHEGVSSPEEFIKVWISIHPRRGFSFDDWVYVHHFRRIP